MASALGLIRRQASLASDLLGADMFGMFGRKPQAPFGIGDLNDIKKLIEKKGPAQAGDLIRNYATNGNIPCQVFLSNMYLVALSGDSPSQEIRDDFEKYTKLAAQSNDVASQYNLAKYYIDQIDAESEYLYEEDINYIKRSKYWYKKAADQGSEVAKQMLKELECFPYEPSEN